MAKEILILDNEIQARYEKIHGDNELCFVSVDLFNMMAEIRLEIEYGDYLAYTCAALKGETMSDIIYRLEKLEW